MAVSAYWATMFAGRVILGPVAERAGPARVLAGAVAGVPLGAALVLGLAMCGLSRLISLGPGALRLRERRDGGRDRWAKARYGGSGRRSGGR